MPLQEPQVAAAVARGVALISEVDLFAWAVRECLPQSKIVAITGSNGKTTTTALTAYLLNEAGVPAIACGNISPSLLDALMDAMDSGKLLQERGLSDTLPLMVLVQGEELED